MPNPSVGSASRTAGVNVDRLRKARGLTVTELAYRVGLGRVSLTQLIQGRRRADADDLVALALELGVTVGQLCGLERLTVTVDLEGRF